MDNFTKMVTFTLVLLAAFLGNSICQSEPIPVDEYRCTEMGYFPHEQNRHQFYECVRHPGDPTRLVSYTYNCGEMECFDKEHDRKCSVEACSRNDTGSEEFQCLRDKLQQDAQKQCENETLTVLKNLMPKMVEFTAHRGNPDENLRLTLRDANLEMRRNYGSMIENTGKNVYPLMVATDGEPDYFGVGGVFKIYLKDGSMKRIIPVSPAFEIHKSLSHLVLGVFSIISPYFRNPSSLNWQPALNSFRQTIMSVQFLLKNGETGMTGDELRHALDILRNTINYINDSFSTNSVDMEGYRRFANELAPLIEKSMIIAAKAHAEDTIPALQKLKEEMGEEEWKKMYIIIPTVWPVSLFNIRLQALEKVMSFEQIKNQVLIVEGARDEADAKTTLGRVVADRAVAQLVWGGLEGEAMRDHVFSLSTRRDLLSSTASKELNEVCRQLEEAPDKQNCPYAGRAGKGGTRIHDNGPPDLYATMLRS